ncbi:3-oxoacyl-ACP reductase FabG [Nocardia terpenica]|uniref:3-oxoacyl-[acyl-carrier-protein] reductase MabA n=1 Tax=Nocardia terpenica TaxID=455432 RepID=A0A164LIJ5_9NOCA|nr:3-oxoacyl-ACP reductase FabG [Nocardia terpenica]KZM72450.1 beta-ketoacyl-ACP reductase [Nocardia terpenica]NQE92683.1 3-oxoacyl-ACP reductase FabG [Nocardia terpenica]
MHDQRPVAVVTGGSRGIGREIVLELARGGYDVAFCYNSDATAAEKVVAAATGGSVLAIRADVRDEDQVNRFLETAAAELGSPDCVVTSAGVTADQSLAAMDSDSWHRVVDTNLTGVFHVCRRAVFEMVKQRSGAIVTIASVSGVYGNPGQTNYSAAKAGIIGFTKSLAKEVGRFGVRANTIVPGYIDSDMTGHLTDAKRATLEKTIALRRFGTPADVAALVSFLVSERARYITGAVLHVDGGITL